MRDNFEKVRNTHLQKELDKFNVILTGNVANGNLMQDFENYSRTQVCLVLPSLLIKDNLKKKNFFYIDEIVSKLIYYIELEFKDRYNNLKA